MPDWPHSPIHRLADAGTFMVTAGTYQKRPLFSTRSRMDFLCATLFDLAKKYDWQLQAWAVFPNHYHLVAISPAKAQSLRLFIQHFHSITAKWLNAEDGTAGRRVWFEYWETMLTYEKSYLARLSYVHRNAVHHRVVREATLYPWCSAGWFARTADRAFWRTVNRFDGKGIKVPDDYRVEPAPLEFPR